MKDAGADFPRARTRNVLLKKMPECVRSEVISKEAKRESTRTQISIQGLDPSSNKLAMLATLEKACQGVQPKKDFRPTVKEWFSTAATLEVHNQDARTVLS